MYKMLISAALLFAALHAHAQSTRLIATSYYLHTGTNYQKRDTANLSYSSGRSLTAPVPFNYDQWAYDELYSQSYNNQGQPEDDMHNIQEFINGNNVAKFVRLNWINNAWDTALKIEYHYTNNMNDTLYQTNFTTNPINRSKTAYIYNQYGLEQYIFYAWNVDSNKYVPNARVTYTYVSGLKTMELSETFSNNAWEPYLRVSTTYIGNNPDSILTQSWDGTYWQTTYLTTNTYDVNNDLVVIEKFFTAFFTNMNKIINTYDNAHHLLTKTNQIWDNGQYNNASQNIYTYTNAGFVESDIYLNWNNGQFQPANGSTKKYYYYEDFDPATVSNIQKGNGLQVFPNPATNTITIQSFTEQKEVFGVTIYDATGRSVRHWNEAPTSMYQKTVDVSGLAPGNYFLRINNQPQEMIKFTIL